ncbi:hexosaminidase [Diaminobutyricimonas aerilata]|uniref:beta-N-acetylhexosaminidase n=1 Tax=Diaminobutyricimonas aerilata TaxID=1162967 RepID=A0A2M9CL72_9MICO|nr:beta-N-acetylhexosaminidase [Diaminobutyricimonas aerilata]PJJ72641.1 hexosaminidase [Diaminobutyricimonas aerilata]
MDAMLPPDDLALVPRPRLVRRGHGTFLLSSEGQVHERIDPALPPEAYGLDIDDDGVRIRGGDAAGVFLARQTLLQLYPAHRIPTDRTRLIDPATGSEPIRVPHVHIEDEPEYRWRGFMLDVARHFMPASFVLRVIDQLAAHKLNVLHLHLTDDQGWRLPVPAYPRLTEVGGRRPESLVGYDDERDDVDYDGTPHGGAYTREELEHIVAYAARRHITVVPEVDLPGHVQAALAAYPELGSGEPAEVRTRWGVSTRVLDVGPATLDFVRAVLDEVTSIFPGAYIHAGGDEVPKREWRASPVAQRRIAELGLAGEEALQGWFTARVDELLRAHGRRLVAWDEVVQGGAPQDTLVMAWRGRAEGVRAARAGHDVVMSPRDEVYFDLPQSTHPAEPVGFPDPVVSLERVFAFEPHPAELGEAAGRIVGAQANLWTEYVPTTEHAEYMMFPRLCAFAETVWRRRLEPGRERDFGEFHARLERHLDRLHAAGVRFRRLEHGASAWVGDPNPPERALAPQP